jgi:uncharacterized protein YcaQ
MVSLGWLRRQVVGWSIGSPARLAEALARIEFVQADPIKAPAPAQDLILRHRVSGYRAGDLDRGYPRLPLDEDILHVYGFMSRRLRELVQPRLSRRTGRPYEPEGLAADVLAFVRERGVTHPRQVQAHFGRATVANAWGGRSAATTGALEALHYYGLLRVVRREAGIRVYEPAQPWSDLDPAARAQARALRVAHLLAPAPEASLRAAVNLTHQRPGLRSVIPALLAAGDLEAGEIDGVRYVWPATLTPVEADPPARVRLLAPFDPVVWDRRRFEHVWGWAYRFEAYTPVAKRKLGYYAMPLLWRDRVIGWANCSREEGGVRVELGFVNGRPRQKRFDAALEAEIARLTAFLQPPRRVIVAPPE